MKSVNNLRKVGPKTVVSRATVRIQAKNASFCKDREDSHLTVESALVPTEQPITPRNSGEPQLRSHGYFFPQYEAELFCPTLLPLERAKAHPF